MAWLGRGVSSSSAASTFSVVDRYPDRRLEGVDAICCAVDSLSDRRAADDISVRHRCALLDSGVEGDRASVHVAVPHVSVPWSVGPRDPPDWEPPSCVLGNFPHTFAHASKWSRNLFETLFEEAPRKTNAYLREPGYVAETLNAPGRDALVRLADLKELHASLVADRPLGLGECVRWARMRFDDLFVEGPRRMLESFPTTQRTSSGLPFWSGTKRCPEPLTFSLTDPAHLSFVVAAANLRAAAYGLRGRRDAEFHAELLEAMAAEQRGEQGKLKQPTSAEVAAAGAARSDVGSGGGGENEAAKLAAAEAECEAILAALPPRESLAGYRLSEASFVSRDPLHAAFVAAAASCRAQVHRIPAPPPHDLASIAADARPALPAPAALAGALVALETYKLAAVRAAKNAAAAAAAAVATAAAAAADEPSSTATSAAAAAAAAAAAFRHSYSSMGTNLHASAAPEPVTKTTVVTAAGCPNLVWSLWDVIELDGRGVGRCASCVFV